MESVKKENERIMRAQKELNQILMERFHTEGKDKRTESEDMGYQHKDEKIKQVKNESSSSSEVYRDSYKQNFHYTSDSSEDNHHTRNRSLNLTRKSLGNSRRSSHQPLMEKLRRGKKQNPG